jgi:hypothetical protein
MQRPWRSLCTQHRILPLDRIKPRHHANKLLAPPALADPQRHAQHAQPKNPPKPRQPPQPPQLPLLLLLLLHEPELLLLELLELLELLLLLLLEEEEEPLALRRYSSTDTLSEPSPALEFM